MLGANANMSFYWADDDCGCERYIIAVKCAGEPDPDPYYDLYVKTDDMPDEKVWFKADSICYSLDPNDEQVCLLDRISFEGQNPETTTTAPIVSTDNSILTDTGAFAGLDELQGGKCIITASTGGNTGEFWIISNTNNVLTLWGDVGTGTDVEYYVCAWAPIRITYATDSYDDCADCTHEDNDDDEGSSPWRGRGPGFMPCEFEWHWVCGGGGWIAPWADTWKLAVVCSAHGGWEDVLVVYVNAETVSENKYFRYRGICYSVLASAPDIDSGDRPTTDRVLIDITGSYDDCDGCTKGVQAVLCAGQTNPEKAYDLWVIGGALEEPLVTVNFRYESYCYELDTSKALAVINEGAIVFGHVPTDWYEDCDDCVAGRQAILCPGQASPGFEVWIRAEDLPEETVYFRFEARCYSIGPGATSNIPEFALLTKPPTVVQYDTCSRCICGLALTEENGVRARTCPKQDIVSIKSYWVRESDIPTSFWSFKIGPVCYWVSPSLVVGKIPAGATIIEPSHQYDNCFDCGTTYKPPDDPPPDDPRPPDPPFDPPPDDPPPPYTPGDPHSGPMYYRLHTCAGEHAGTNTVILTGYGLGTVISPRQTVRDLIAGQCYFTEDPKIQQVDLSPDSYP